jgi:GDP-4-dehydro-6-deoxy-D-mannose reductase
MGVKKLLCVGSGWIASRLAAHATARGWECSVAYQRFRNPAVPNEQLVALPRSRDGLIALCHHVKPDYIAYLLGTSFVPAIDGDLRKAVEDNVVTLTQLCESLLMAGLPLPKLLVVGSASIYGPSEKALREDAAIGPTDNYGAVKVVQERVALGYFERLSLPVVVVRQFNTSGIGQDRRFVLPSIASQVASTVRAGARNVRLSIGDTTVRRDFTAVSDTVEAYSTLLESAAAGSVYNVCTGYAHSIAELAQRASSLFGLTLEFQVEDALVRKGERRRPVVLGDPSRLQALGWRPHTTMDELLQGMVEAQLTALH